MDSRERFTAAASDYASYRPGYPEALVEACVDYAGLTPGAAVVDIGCGTGISTRAFGGRGFRLIGVEPNEAMLAEAVRSGGADYHRGDALRTGLADHVADLITCAQALHWFDLADGADEWRRILKPGGACAAFWNLRLSDGWQATYERLLLEWSEEYDEVRASQHGASDHTAWIRTSGACRDVREREFDNAQRLDWRALLGRANSSSYVIHGIADREGFERALKALFDREARDGAVVFRYRTWLLLWRFA